MCVVERGIEGWKPRVSRGKRAGSGSIRQSSREREREREKTRTSSTRCPSSKKGLPGPCSFFLFFIKNFACFFSFKGPELSSGKSQQPSFFFFEENSPYFSPSLNLKTHPSFLRRRLLAHPLLGSFRARLQGHAVPHGRRPRGGSEGGGSSGNSSSTSGHRDPPPQGPLRGGDQRRRRPRTSDGRPGDPGTGQAQPGRVARAREGGRRRGAPAGRL